jgi:hypothetical protein
LTHLVIPVEVQPRPGETPPRIRFTTQRGGDRWFMIEVRRINGPMLEGFAMEGDPPELTRVETGADSRTMTRVEVYSQEAATWIRVTTVVTTVAGIGLGIALVVLLVALASKSSCPFVFVETPGGVRFVGEGYSGAISRPLQRDDLIPLPALAPGTVRVTVSNHAFETQYTDRLELWLVDHAANERAVAGVDARPMLVDVARPPTRVTALDGSALPTPASDPGTWWESEMATLSGRVDPPLRDGLEVRFAAPTDGAQPVLELDASNTHWLDLVLGRMFAAFGDGLERYLTSSDETPVEEQRAWREREAVELSVEAFVAGRWQRVTTIPTPGPAALRHVAIPLPRGGDGEELRVRLSAGAGFWRIGSLGLSSLRQASPTVTRLSPARATQPDGSDARALLARTDGTYQALPRRGDHLAVEFARPEASAAVARTAFLFASGYYRVHAQPQAQRSVSTLLRLRDEPGAMVRFSYALYREALRVVREEPVRAP